MNQLKTTLDEQNRKNKNLVHDSLDADDDSLSRDISSKGVPTSGARQKQQPSGNPLLFDFEHYHDPQLTPRKKWQQKIVIVDAELAEQKQKFQGLVQENAQMKAQLEKEILALSSKLRESDAENDVLKERLQQETRLKEEYHHSFKRAQFDLEKVQDRIQNERVEMRDKVDRLENDSYAKQGQLNDCNTEISQLKDENHRLKSTIVNKDS